MGVIETARCFLPAMIARDSGVFVAMSSGWGRSTSAGLGPYCASKFAVEGLVGVLNDDLPPQVCAIALDPGNRVNTNMLNPACLTNIMIASRQMHGQNMP
ncbi:SDR family NAD(P)-dependent oxidoreductase [Rhizobium sp. CFBP 8762]|nr:SDR family NAD(P)-dependent oxidoreductase [Rhizobium sp. CFBP 8762]